MFSGIVEVASSVLAWTPQGHHVVLKIHRPAEFDDLHIGHSVAVNGVCLTVDQLVCDSIEFVLGPETLTVTGWDKKPLESHSLVNLERSLRLGDRLHGHLVTGHVDGRGRVLEVQGDESGHHLKIGFSKEMARYFWAKGSVAVNGVSLTLNKVTADQFEVGLIPETLRRTNLGRLHKGDGVNLESDTLARGLVAYLDSADRHAAYLHSQEVMREAELG